MYAASGKDDLFIEINRRDFEITFTRTIQREETVKNNPRRSKLHNVAARFLFLPLSAIRIFVLPSSKVYQLLHIVQNSREDATDCLALNIHVSLEIYRDLHRSKPANRDLREALKKEAWLVCPRRVFQHAKLQGSVSALTRLSISPR